MSCNKCNPKDQFYTSNFWTLALHPNATYLARSFLIPKRHVSEESQLSLSEILEGTLLRHTLDQVIRNNFHSVGSHYYATNANSSGHLHWHLIPRYVETQCVEGFIFTDPQGAHYVPYDKALVMPPHVKEAVIERLKLAFEFVKEQTEHLLAQSQKDIVSNPATNLRKLQPPTELELNLAEVQRRLRRGEWTVS